MFRCLLVITKGLLLCSLVLLGACGGGGGDGGGGGGGGGGDDGGGGGGVSRTIELLGFAQQPSQLIVRNGVLYWLDASDTPLGSLSLADMMYTPLFTAMPIPEDAASDGTDVYWVSGGRLFKTSLNNATITLLDEGQRDAAGVTAAIVMDSTHVYWANTLPSPNCSPACTFTIRRVPKSGGAATTVVTTSQVIVALALAAGQLFWEEEGIGPVNSDGSVGSKIKKIPTNGGAETVLVNGLLNGLIPPPSPGFAPASWHPRGGIAVDGTDVYFADADFVQSYRVMKVSASGGGVTVLTQIMGSSVRDIELDSTKVYWVDGDSLKSLPKSGGGFTTLVGMLPSPVSLAYSAGVLYWLESVCCAHGQKGTVRAVAVGGGLVATLQEDIDSPVVIATDASTLFWVEGGPIGSIEGFGGIKSIPLAGGSQTVLVESVQGGPFDVDDTHVYFANAFTIKRVPITGGPVQRLAIGDFYATSVVTDGANVYWVEDQPIANVRRVPVNGGPITFLASGDGPAGVMRLDATHVYWMNHEDTIRRFPKAGGTQETIVGPVAGSLTDFVVSGGNVYFSEWDGGQIRRVSVNGGNVTTLATPGADQTRRITTDGESVYWVDQTNVCKVSVTGANFEFIVTGSVISDPFFPGGIAVDQTSVYWTETATWAIVTAIPK